MGMHKSECEVVDGGRGVGNGPGWVPQIEIEWVSMDQGVRHGVSKGILWTYQLINHSKLSLLACWLIRGHRSGMDLCLAQQDRMPFCSCVCGCAGCIQMVGRGSKVMGSVI